jgi:hypothetical protein
MERRCKARFPVELNVRYRTLGGAQVFGKGRTVNISSCGLLIASDQAVLRAGIRLQVTLEWPLLLHGMTPLQLIGAGQVVRSQPALFALRLERYQFRTRKREASEPRAALADSSQRGHFQIILDLQQQRRQRRTYVQQGD